MRPFTILLPAFLIVSCSDYGFAGEDHVWWGHDSGSPETDADADGDGDTDTDGPPEGFLDDCLSDTEAYFEGGEIYVKSWEQIEAAGTIVVDTQGWYHVYDYSLAESRDAQTNEVSYLRVRNDGRPDGEPYWDNCAGEWFVDDFDNEGDPEEQRIYTGTFWLEAGDNALTMYHYCPRERSGYCPEFHDTSDSSSTCDSDGPNSVHFNGDGLCLRRLELPAP